MWQTGLQYDDIANQSATFSSSVCDRIRTQKQTKTFLAVDTGGFLDTERTLPVHRGVNIRPAVPRGATYTLYILHVLYTPHRHIIYTTHDVTHTHTDPQYTQHAAVIMCVNLGKIFTETLKCSIEVIRCNQAVMQHNRWCLSRQSLRYTALGTGCAPLLHCLGRLKLSTLRGTVK